MAAGGDGPVAGGGVVHRVVKAGRRDRRRLGRERRAHVVVDREVAVRRGEDRGQRCRVAAGSAHRRARHLEGEGDAVRRTSTLGRCQDLGCRALGRRIDRRAFAAKRRAGDRPAGQRRRPEGDALDPERQRAFMRSRLRSRPSTRTQLLPPKPNELLSASRTSPRGRLDADLRSAGGVERSRVGDAGQEAVLDRQQAGRGLDDSGGAEGVAGEALGRDRVGARREAPRHQRRLDLVVLLAGGAVQVDVVDLARVDAGAGQGVVERALGAEAFGMRRRHVMRVAGFAVAEQGEAVAGRRRRRAFEQGEAGRFADADAVALGVERPAGIGRDQLQGVEAEQDAAAQGVDAADDRRVGQAEPEHPLGAGEHLGARRAGGRDGDARPFEAERLLDEAGQRMRRVHERVAVARRKAAFAVERAVRVFGGADARGRGAEHERDPGRAVALARRMGGVDEVVGGEAEPGEPVVAAIPVGQRLGQALRLDAGDAADPGGKRARTEVVGAQRRLAGAQGREQRCLAGAGRGRRRVGRDPEGREARRRHGRLGQEASLSERAVGLSPASSRGREPRNVAALTPHRPPSRLAAGRRCARPRPGRGRRSPPRRGRARPAARARAAGRRTPAGRARCR